MLNNPHQNHTINLQQAYHAYLHEKINLIAQRFLKILEINSKVIILSNLGNLKKPSTFKQKSSSSLTFSLRYYKDIVNLLFWVLWACLSTRTQSDPINLQKTFVFICRQKINFSPCFSEDIAKIYKLLILGTLGMPGCTHGVLKEPDDIDSAPKILSTLKVHQVKRDFIVVRVCEVQFFKVADSLPFHEEFYRRYGDPEVCDYPLLPFSFNPDNTCAACKDNYLWNKDWFVCKICEQWFHECCFMA